MKRWGGKNDLLKKLKKAYTPKVFAQNMCVGLYRLKCGDATVGWVKFSKQQQQFVSGKGQGEPAQIWLPIPGFLNVPPNQEDGRFLA